MQACLGAYMSETDSFKDEPEVINLVDDESDDGKRKKQKKRGHSRLVIYGTHKKNWKKPIGLFFVKETYFTNV